MHQKPKAIIIPFPGTKKEENPLMEGLKAVLATIDAEPERQQVQNSGKEVQAAFSVVVSGNGQVGSVIHGNTYNTYHVEKPPTPNVIVQTGVGAIDAQQKRRLLDLRDEIVKDSVVRNTPKMPGSVMIGLNRYMKVNKYDEILAVDFEKALNWMVRQRAILNSARSAPKKLPAWRNGRIKAIHTRCKEMGFEDWRIEHMKKKFGKSSMIDLADADLETLYRTVMSKK